jgi:hypothetical protein
MGFHWGAIVSLEYCVEIELKDKVSLWYMVKRLAEYEAGYAKRAKQAALTKEPVCALLSKKRAHRNS